MKHPYLFIAAAVLAGCAPKAQNQTPVQIPETVTETSFEEAVSSIELIPLSADRYLGQAIDMVISDGCYIFADRMNNKILRFSTDGEFLNEIGRRGNGPAEYVAIKNIQTLDDKLIVFSLPDKVLYYDYDGNCIESREVASLGTQDYQFGDRYLAYYGYTADGEPRAALVKDGEREEEFLVTEKRVMPLGKITPIFSEVDKGIAMLDSYSNTVYLYSDGTIEPYVSFDFGKYGIEDSFFSYEDVMEGAMYLMSREFAVISRYCESKGDKTVEIDIQGPTSMKKLHGLNTGKEWRWFSCGELGISPLAGGFKLLQDGYLYFLLDPSLLENLPDGLRKKISNPECLEDLTPDSNYAVAKIKYTAR